MKKSRIIKLFIFGMVIGFIFLIPLAFEHLEWYLYGVGVLLVYLLFVGILNYYTDFHYVYRPFRNKKNKWLGFYCFIFAHHALINNYSEDRICTTCGKISKVDDPDDGLWSVTITK